MPKLAIINLDAFEPENQSSHLYLVSSFLVTRGFDFDIATKPEEMDLYDSFVVICSEIYSFDKIMLMATFDDTLKTLLKVIKKGKLVYGYGSIGASLSFALGLGSLVKTDIKSSFFLKYGAKTISKNKTKFFADFAFNSEHSDGVVDICAAQVDDLSVGFLCGNSVLTSCELDFEILQDFVETSKEIYRYRIPLIKEKSQVFLPEYAPKMSTFEFLVEVGICFEETGLIVKKYRYYQVEVTESFVLEDFMQNNTFLQFGESFAVRSQLSNQNLHILAITKETHYDNTIIKILEGNFYSVSGQKDEIQALLQTSIFGKAYIYPLPETTYSDFIGANINFVLEDLDFGLPKHSFHENQDMYLCKNKFIAILTDKFWVSDTDYLCIPFFGVVTNMTNSWWLSQTRHLVSNNLLTNLSSNILVFDTQKPLNSSVKIVQIEDGQLLSEIQMIHKLQEENLGSETILKIEYQITNLFNFCQQIANSKDIFIANTEINIAWDEVEEKVVVVDTLLSPAKTIYMYQKNDQFTRFNQEFWDIWHSNSYHLHPTQANFSKEIPSLLSLEFIDFYEHLTGNQFAFPDTTNPPKLDQMSAIEKFLLYDQENTDIRSAPHKLGL